MWVNIGARQGVKGMKRLYKTIIFPLKWIFMSSKARYAYLRVPKKACLKNNFLFRRCRIIKNPSYLLFGHLIRS